MRKHREKTYEDPQVGEEEEEHIIASDPLLAPPSSSYQAIN
jgi:hypothetical protein